MPITMPRMNGDDAATTPRRKMVMLLAPSAAESLTARELLPGTSRPVVCLNAGLRGPDEVADQVAVLHAPA